MLEAIRQHAQGWIAKVILGLIAVTFALFGIDSYMKGDKSGNVVAEVGDARISRDELTREIQTQTDRRREALGPAFDRAETETTEFRQRVLDSMIERKALLQDAQALKIYAPDPYVAAVLGQIPAFQEDGKFSQARYEKVLRNNGRTPAAFENELRQGFMLDVVASPATLAAFPANTSLTQIARLVAQQREVSWTDLPASSVAGEIRVTPADIEREYAANKARFTDPAQIRAEYVTLDMAAVAAGVTVSDQAVADFYAGNAARFGQPERRSASHILIAVDKNADPATRAKAKAHAEALTRTLQEAPVRFAELAKKESADPGSAANGGSLGSFPRGAMVKPFEDAVFGMKMNEIRGPVESEYGYHIIRLDGIEPARVSPLAQVRPAVEAEVRKQQAQRVFATLADNFSNVVYENATSLQPAAAAVKAKVQQTDWMTEKAAPAPFNNPALASALFGADAIKSRQNTEAIEVQPGTLVAARVIDYRPARLRPLAEVSAAIEAELRAKEATRLLAEKGKATIQTLSQGKEPGLAWSPFHVINRQPFAEFDAAGLKAVFSANAEKLPAYTGFSRPDGSYRIVRITRVVEPSTVDPVLMNSISSGVAQAQQQAELKAMVELAKAAHKVKIKPNAIDAK